MTKQEFSAELRRRLYGLPQNDIEERLTFYSEMIDDRMEEGLSEEEAVAELGPIEDIITHIMSEIPLSRLVKEKVKSRPTLETWQIVLIVLSSIVWLPLLGSISSLIFSIYIGVWSLVLLIWLCDFAFAIKAILEISSFVTALAEGNVWYSLSGLGRAMIWAGVAILLFFAAKEAVKAVINLTKKIFIKIKSWIMKKEDVQ